MSSCQLHKEMIKKGKFQGYSVHFLVNTESNISIPDYISNFRFLVRLIVCNLWTIEVYSGLLLSVELLLFYTNPSSGRHSSVNTSSGQIDILCSFDGGHI